MCDKNNQKPLDNSLDLINTFLPLLTKLSQEECQNCRQHCEETDENETWQYYIDGYKYCYDCWDELDLENQ